ncbi:hypothetical protein [Halalkalicoccus jeotgali]|uniref:hypothetical protein n=1 Tax=Halalkalicoccus jeotgali TaxID=413810 RepID=UPI001EE63D51|nr:hypothetical protein [Halalkalicoccus jeotgali]
MDDDFVARIDESPNPITNGLVCFKVTCRYGDAGRDPGFHQSIDEPVDSVFEDVVGDVFDARFETRLRIKVPDELEIRAERSSFLFVNNRRVIDW